MGGGRSERDYEEAPDLTVCNSYNRYLAVASRVVRQSLKEDKRQAVGRRGQIDLRIQKWTVRANPTWQEACRMGIREVPLFANKMWQL